MRRRQPAIRAARHRAAARSSPAAWPPIRTELGRFGRQVSGYALQHLLPERGFDVRRALVGSEGTLAIVTSATVAAGPRPAAPGAGRARLPGHGRAADAAPALLPLQPATCEGMDSRLVDVVRGCGAAAAGPGPAARLGLAVRRGHRRHRGRGAEPRAGQVLRDRRAPSSGQVVTDAGARRRAVADPRAGRRAWPAGSAGRRARLSRLGGLRGARPRRSAATCATWTILLDRAQAGRHPVRPLRRRLPAPAAGLPAGPARRPGRAARLPAARRPSWSPGTAGRCPASTATAGPAASCCRSCTRPRHGAVRPGQGRLRPGRRAQPRRAGPAPAAGRRHPGPARAAAGGAPSPAAAERLGLHVRPRRRRLRGGRAPLHRASASAWPARRARRRVMCPSYQATRDEKDSTRGRARMLQEMVNGSRGHRRLARPGGPRGAGPVPVLQGLLVRVPGRRGHGRLQGRGAAPGLPRAAVRPRSHYALGQLPRWARLASRAPRLANAALAGAGLGRLARLAAGIDPRRSLPPFAAAVVPRLVPRAQGGAGTQAAGPGAGRPVMLLSTRSPTSSPRRSAGPRWRCWPTPGSRDHPGPADLLRDHLDQHRPARRRPAGSWAARSPS